MANDEAANLVSATHDGDPRPLVTLLSQVLVAYTVEFDNEFERRMGGAGFPGARLSLVVWANLMRFVADRMVSVRELAAQALASAEQIKFELGCLERWRFVKLDSDPADSRPVPLAAHRRSGREFRDGWGSGRGIRAEWRVQLTSKGLIASEIWPPLFGEIDQRWQRRFGKAGISHLQQALQNIACQLEVELPHGLPGGYGDTPEYPRRVKRVESHFPLPTLLSHLLLTFRLEFNRESGAPLQMCANTLRVLGEKPIRLAEIPRLTGGSPETTDIGWQSKPYVVVKSDPSASRGKVVELSPRGLSAQQTYRRLIEDIEKRWEGRFGKKEVGRLRESLHGLFGQRGSKGPLLSEGMVPPPGTVRAGDQAPALGRRDVGAAARQRMRDLVAQTEAFVRDPAGTLPHFPLWDMNRGFGP